MTVPIEVTVALHGFENMTKETPALPVLQAAGSAVDGYISATTISFTYVAGASTINDSATSFGTYNFTGCDDEYILVETTSGLNDGLYVISGDENGVITLASGTANELVTETAAAAGTVVLNCVPIFRIYPTRPMSKGIIIYSEGVVSTGETGMIPCLLNGTHWAADNGVYTAFTATITTDSTYYLWVETAPYVQSDGSIWFFLKCNPTGTQTGVYTDHVPEVGYLQLP